MANVRYPGTAGTTPGTITASDVMYDNTTSGLTADDVQEALDEIDGNVDTLSGKVYKTDDSTDTTIASDDKIPFYDVSTTSRKNITVANVVSGAVSNPNLLDNPWFTVNQRGQSQYTALGYSVDRWKLHDSNPFTVDVTDSGVTLTHANNSTNSYFDHFIDEGVRDKLGTQEGKTLTLSVMLSDNTIYSASGVIPTYTSTNQRILTVNIGNFSIDLNVRTTLMAVIIRSNVANATISIKAVKLEMGEISTLALDTAPNYATELLKCQRYFVRIDNTSGGVCVGNGITLNIADRAVLCIKLPVSMRAKPSVVGITDVECVSGSQTISVSSIGSSSHDNGYETLNVVATGATIGTSYLVRLKSNKQLDFSADL